MNREYSFVPPHETLDTWNMNITGNCNFKDDIWDLSAMLNNKRSNVTSASKLNFKLLSSKPLIVEPIKRYFYIRLGEVKVLTITGQYYNIASKLINFLHLYKYNSLKEINSKIFTDFNYWLKITYLNMSANNLAHISNTLFKIIKLGQALGFPNISDRPIILETPIWRWWYLQKGEYDKGDIDKSIPVALWKNIIQKAWSEKDVTQYIKNGASRGLYRINNVKFAILIQAYTGLRISEVVYLKTGCAEKDNQEKYWLSVEIEKTEDEPFLHKILIPEDIYILILHLEEISAVLREEADEPNYLFYTLSKRYKKEFSNQKPKRFKPVTLESGKYNTALLHPFLKRNNIPCEFLNSQNETIKLTSHTFRHTFSNIAVAQKGINPAVIKTHFRHLSLEMTMHYIRLNKNELKKSYIQGMIESGNIYTQGREGDSFKAIVNEAKIVENINDSIDNLSKLFGINPLPFGLCLYDFKRGNCPHLGATSCYMIGCSDFITNNKFLNNFEHEKSLLEKQVNICKNNNQAVEEKKARYQIEKIEKIIKNIIKD